MKTKKSILVAILTVLLFASCDEAGKTYKSLNGNEQTLPVELRGLKVYSVATGGGNYVKVAILNGEINSTTYSVGKFQETTVILNKPNGRLIEVSEIIVENDSIIVCRK